jgi:hypothetical protein
MSLGRKVEQTVELSHEDVTNLSLHDKDQGLGLFSLFEFVCLFVF